MIRRMTLEDVPAVMRLKETAGWNQTEQDWSNVLALAPDGCWVYEVDGAVAGCTTAICYGQRLAWIGMMLVLPEFRRRGIGRALMRHAVDSLERRGIGLIKLDATDMGRPLYLEFGFRDECPIERWSAIVSAAPPETDADPAPRALRQVDEIAELDRRAFGTDRSAVLSVLQESFPEQCYTVPGAYLMARPGTKTHFLGPCIAERDSDADRLIRHLLSRLGEKAVFWDLLPANQAARRLAERMGFRPARRLVRMVRPGSGSLSEPLRCEIDHQFATAGFEYG